MLVSAQRESELENLKAGNPNSRGRLSTVDLLIRVPCFVKKGVNIIFNIK